jgi:hypothetical protein
LKASKPLANIPWNARVASMIGWFSASVAAAEG